MNAESFDCKGGARGSRFFWPEIGPCGAKNVFKKLFFGGFFVEIVFFLLSTSYEQVLTNLSLTTLSSGTSHRKSPRKCAFSRAKHIIFLLIWPPPPNSLCGSKTRSRFFRSFGIVDELKSALVPTSSPLHGSAAELSWFPGKNVCEKHFPGQIFFGKYPSQTPPPPGSAGQAGGAGGV